MELVPVPKWLEALRESMASSIKPDDLKEVMLAQVKKAKDGDVSAARFVMEQAHKLMESGQPKNVTVTQNNFYDTPADKRPDAPISVNDDRESRVKRMAARQSTGIPLIKPEDKPEGRRLTDEEEKQLRAQEDAVDPETDVPELRRLRSA